MARTARLAVLALATAGFAAAAPVGWLGLTYDATQNAAVLNNLNTDGSINGVVGTYPLQAGEQLQVDAFRCRPDGNTCQFLVDGGDSGAAVLYNVSITGPLLSRTVLPGVVAHNLHSDMLTGAAITITLPPSGGANITGVQNWQPFTIMDVSQYVPLGSTVLPGGSTHCSDNGSLWFNVVYGGGVNGLLVAVNLHNASVVSVTRLGFPGFSAMWAQCNDQQVQNVVGGIVVQNGQLEYGTVDAGGNFLPTATGSLPPGVVPTGLLSEPDGYDWFAPAAAPGASKGYLAFGNYNGGVNSVVFTPSSNFFYGAARFQ